MKHFHSTLVVALSLCTIATASADPAHDVDDNWQALPGFARGEDTGTLGNTHGGVVIDGDGLIYSNTDTPRSIVVHEPDGTFVRAFGAAWPGIHGIAIREENGTEYI